MEQLTVGKRVRIPGPIFSFYGTIVALRTFRALVRLDQEPGDEQEPVEWWCPKEDLESVHPTAEQIQHLN